MSNDLRYHTIIRETHDYSSLQNNRTNACFSLRAHVVRFEVLRLQHAFPFLVISSLLRDKVLA